MDHVTEGNVSYSWGISFNINSEDHFIIDIHFFKEKYSILAQWLTGHVT